jgi:hypothetical protein
MEKMKKLSVSQIDYWAVVNRCLSTGGLVGRRKYSGSWPVDKEYFAGTKRLLGVGGASVIPEMRPKDGKEENAMLRWVGVLGRNSTGTVKLISGMTISRNEAEIIIKSVKAAAVALANEYGLTELEFADLIRRAVNPWFNKGRWLMGLLDEWEPQWNVYLRKIVRREFEGKFRNASQSWPPGLMFKKTLHGFAFSKRMEVT